MASFQTGEGGGGKRVVVSALLLLILPSYNERVRGNNAASELVSGRLPRWRRQRASTAPTLRPLRTRGTGTSSWPPFDDWLLVTDVMEQVEEQRDVSFSLR